MEDRELLELAAKAAGINLPDHMNADGTWVYKDPHKKNWNPLTDDGDALRLAVKIGLTIECDFIDSDTCTVSETRGEILAEEYSGMTGDVIGATEIAATRRAIVRAAAEIGKTK